MNLVFLGMPGAGKGTYADILAEETDIPHLSTGEIIRVSAANGDPLGVKATEFQEKGIYVPDEIVVGIFEKRLKEADCKNGFILDNFPGNVSQAKAIEGRIRIDRVLYYETSEDVRIHRISGRLTCRKCGQIYHKVEVPSKKKGICDTCGGELYQRADQKPKVLKQRFKEYEKQLGPLIEYYKKSGLLRVIDANKSIRIARDEIMGNTKKAIQDLM